MMVENQVNDEKRGVVPADIIAIVPVLTQQTKRMKASRSEKLLVCAREDKKIVKQRILFHRYPLRSQHGKRDIKMMLFSTDCNSPKYYMTNIVTLHCYNLICMSE